MSVFLMKYLNMARFWQNLCLHSIIAHTINFTETQLIIQYIFGNFLFAAMSKTKALIRWNAFR